MFSVFKPLSKLCLIVCMLSLTACLSQKQFIYFQENAAKRDSIVAMNQSYVPVIQKNDVLNIYVTSISSEVSKLFNFVDNPQNDQSSNGYFVDVNGNITVPLIGKVKVDGLTTIQARDSLRSKLEKFITNPTVKLNIRNYRIMVLGEVAHPGYFESVIEQMTLTEALARAGDLTQYGKRDDVMIIRENKGKKEFIKFDLTKRDLFTSDNYYLRSNDIIYVSAIKQKKYNVQTYWKLLPLVFSGISLGYVVYKSINPDSKN